MTDDIVTQLREALETDDSILLTMPRPTVKLMADEIERLRADRGRWRTVAKELAAALGRVEYAEAAYTDLVDNEQP